MASVFSVLLSLFFTALVSCGKSGHHGDPNAQYAISTLYTNETTKRYEFKVGYTYVRHLNTKKRLIAVNGMFPGSTIYANEDDYVVIRVTNAIKEDVAIHWPLAYTSPVRGALSCLEIAEQRDSG